MWSKMKTRFFSCIFTVIIFNCVPLMSFSQGRGGNGGTMEVSERNEAGQAVLFDFDFPRGDLQNLIKFISEETDLTIIASENDIKDKKFALTNLKSVTIEETLEKIKTVLSQYNLTMIRTDSTILITTFEKAVQMKVPIKRITADPSQVEQTDEIQTYIVQLSGAVASELVNSLKTLLNKSANIFADASSNLLIITDVASNIHRVVTILQAVDEEPEIPLKVEVVPLVNAEATSLARTLSDVFSQDGMVANILRKLGSAKDEKDVEKLMQRAKEEGAGIDMLRGLIQIVPDENSNSLIIKASEANITALKNLIEQLDTVSNVQTEIKIFRLDFAIAENVAETLEDLITGISSGGSSRRDRGRSSWRDRERRERERRDRQRGRGDRGRGGQGNQGIVGTVSISSDERLNAILVSSDPRNFSFLDKIITELDEADPQDEMQIYFLKFADAQTLTETLENLFEGGTGSDDDRPWWERGRSRDRGGDEGVGGFGIQGEVSLVPDLRLNALLVSTPSQNFATIDKLIKDLDVNMPSQEWGTKIYYLKYADAENIEAVINNVYQGSSSSSGRRGFFDFLPSRRSQSQGSLAGNVVAEAYPTLNSIIVSTSTQRNFELITQFIEELDVPTPEGQREVTKLIRLEYAEAEELEQLLERVWDEGDSSSSSGRFSFSRFMASGGQAEQKDVTSLRGRVEVEADNQTNSVLVRTLQRYMADAVAMIRQLDFVRGQVWINIQILEVTLDENTRFGLEITAQENKIFGAELTDKNPLVGNIETQLGLAQQISGFNYSLVSNEYMALLHTLMRQNKVKTLSTPSLLARDNTSVSWSSGRRIPYLQSINVSSNTIDGGISQPLYNYDFIDPPVGINIDLIPHITRSKPDTNGLRTIGLEIEQIQASNFIEFTDFNAPITEDRTFSGYIDIQDGQQIVVGGMIKSKQTEVENKVPFLGDIPLIGGLFRSTETIVENSEVVILITPHIVDMQNADDIEKLKQRADEWRHNGSKEMQSGSNQDESNQDVDADNVDVDEWQHNESKEVQSESNQDEDPADDEDAGNADDDEEEK